jgi:hypothetical protein
MESIELDCPPGAPRPGDLIDHVVSGTELATIVANLPEQPTPFFGLATWYFDIPRERWVSEIQPVIKPRIEALYHNGSIRYGSW